MIKPRITLSEVIEFDDGDNIHVEVYPSGYCLITNTFAETSTNSLEVIDDLITLLGQARDQMRMAKGIKKGCS